jgi:hypothetical protein
MACFNSEWVDGQCASWVEWDKIVTEGELTRIRHRLMSSNVCLPNLLLGKCSGQFCNYVIATSALGDEPHRVFKVIVSADVVFPIFRVNACRLDVGSRRQTWCDAFDWRSVRAGCYPIGEALLVERKKCWNGFVRGARWEEATKEILVTARIVKGDRRISVTTWVEEDVIEIFTYFFQPRAHLQLVSSLFRFANQMRHIPFASCYRRPACKYSSWRWQLEWFSKRWITFNTRNGSSSEVEFVHRTPNSFSVVSVCGRDLTTANHRLVSWSKWLTVE